MVALGTARRRDYARFLWALATGADVARVDNVAVFTCTALSAEADGPLVIQADGDIVGALPATLTVGEVPLLFC